MSLSARQAAAARHDAQMVEYTRIATSMDALQEGRPNLNALQEGMAAASRLPAFGPILMRQGQTALEICTALETGTADGIEAKIRNLHVLPNLKNYFQSRLARILAGRTAVAHAQGASKVQVRALVEKSLGDDIQQFSISSSAIAKLISIVQSNWLSKNGTMYKLAIPRLELLMLALLLTAGIGKEINLRRLFEGDTRSAAGYALNKLKSKLTLLGFEIQRTLGSNVNTAKLLRTSKK